MSNYSDYPEQVRVDFFKQSGKWYCTEAVKWIGHDTVPIHKEFQATLRAHLFKNGKLRFEEMTAVCLEPYHVYAHPLMMKVSQCLKDPA